MDAQFSIYDASAGAGKTFTLVKEYLKILFEAPQVDAYKSILAITFTNKAVNEMKSRVINTLRGFAQPEIHDDFVTMRNLIAQETGLTHDEIQSKSERIFNHLLHNYAAFDILTIDKFTHRVVRSFAADVGLPPDFDLTLDMDQLLQVAVERIVEKTGEEPEITSVLLDFILQKSEDDKSWDVFQDLLKFSKLLKTENHIAEIQLLKDWNLSALSALQKTLKSKEKDIIEKTKSLGQEVLGMMEGRGLQPNHFFKSYVYNYFVKVSNGLVEPYHLFDKYMVSDESRYSKTTPAEAKNAVDELVAPITEIHDRIKELSTEYQWISVALPNLVPLSFLQLIQNELQLVQEEQNVVALATFNKIIHDELAEQPALFIYEKIGERYRHFFIDEFQDTSVLQWENLIPLIANALAGESNTGVKGTAMIVGDPKQAIYRWRGGRAEQFILLSQHENPFPNHQKALIPLTTNHRSVKEVIEFNNDFFKFASRYFENETYRELYESRSSQAVTSKQGGGVQIQFASADLTKEERFQWYLEQTYQTILNELACGFTKRDIVVLTRKNDQGIRVAQFLTEKKIDIISSESLLLAQAPEVKVLEHLLNYLNSKNTEALTEAFYHLHKIHHRPENIHDWISALLDSEKSNRLGEWISNQGFVVNFKELSSKPLYLLVDTLVQDVLKLEKSHAHVQFFMDFVWEFEKQMHQGLDAFLTQWELKKANLSIATSDALDAVRIMTVHKSKGLEFPIVIYPFVEEDFSRKVREYLWLNTPDDSWNLSKILVQESSKMNQLGDEAEQRFSSHLQEAMLDRMNILYVSLTRAEQKLYVFTNLEFTAKGELRQHTLSTFFVEYLQHKGMFENQEFIYDFGDIEVENKKEPKTTKNFHFKEASRKIPTQVIKIAPQEVLMWGSKTESARQWGNVWHEVMSKINNTEDIEKVLNQKINEGVLPTEVYHEMKETIVDLIGHPLLSGYFYDFDEVFNENAILLAEGKMLKPDRVVKKSDGTWGILEYKTGQRLEKHVEQINAYANVLAQMGKKVSSKTLVYINELQTAVEEV